MVMPAFGAYTGGLNVRDRAFAAIFGALDFTAHMLGATRLYAISAALLPAGLNLLSRVGTRPTRASRSISAISTVARP